MSKIVYHQRQPRYDVDILIGAMDDVMGSLRGGAHPPPRYKRGKPKQRS